MVKNDRTKTPVQPPVSVEKYSWLDLARDIARGLFRLADRDKIWGLVVLCLAIVIGVWGGIYLWRVPQEELTLLFKETLSMVERTLRDWAMLGWLFNLPTWAAFAILYSTYRRRITELADRRREAEQKLLGADRPTTLGRINQ